MKPWIVRTAAALAALALLAGGAVLAGTYLADRKANRSVHAEVQPVAYLSDAAALERGRYLYNSRGCVACHAADGHGKTFLDEPNGLLVKGPNISPGPGNVVAGYQPEDWVRAIRHGIKPGGKPLLIMPSEDYNRLTNDDLAALVSHLRHMPPVAGEAAVVRLPAIVKVLYAAGMVQDAYERIDHTLPPAQPVPEEVSVAHGAYVANMCMGCHGANFSGGKIPGAPPDWPVAANLTSGPQTEMARYTVAEQFRQMLASGRRPDGSNVSAVMPFEALKAMSATDADALYLYLKSLPPRTTGER